tara:strand:+ start:261 stop:521 length:261 start_codon:yes stop_codon:yes gene_type:complete
MVIVHHHHHNMVKVDLVAEAEAQRTVDMVAVAADILVAGLVDILAIVGVTVVAADLITLELFILLQIIVLNMVTLESDPQIYINDN